MLIFAALTGVSQQLLKELQSYRWYENDFDVHRKQLVMGTKPLEPKQKRYKTFSKTGRVMKCDSLKERWTGYDEEGNEHVFGPGITCDSVWTYELKKDILHLFNGYSKEHYFYSVKISENHTLIGTAADPQAFYKN